MLKQRTLRNSICAGGVGIHTGEKISVTLRPAAPDTGIIFRRVDLDEPVDIPALSEYVVDTRLSTTLGRGEARISTVEHLLSAAAGMSVDNMYVDVNAPEVPIMDGSSGPFVFLLQSAGVEEQNAPKQFIRIKKPIKIADARDDKKWAKIKPFPGFRIKVNIDFDHPAMRAYPGKASFDFSPMAYVKEVSRSRTFGFLKDYEALRAQNLALGGSLENAIVLDDCRVLNEGGLRYEDEMVKHKILDVIGDMYLLGCMVVGEYEARKPGHCLNRQLREALLAQPEAWERITWEKEDKTLPAPSSLGLAWAGQAG